MRILLAMAVVLSGVLLPTPAHADPIPDEVTSPYDAEPYKTATVTCPAGKVVGMGGRVSDVDGDVVLTGVVVDAALSAVTAVGHARPGFDGAWSVTATVVCGPADVYGPVREVAGNGGQGIATAVCPGEKILYSSGYLIPQPDGTQYVDHVVPSPDLTALAVRAGTTGAGPVTVAAYAICGNPTPDRLRLEQPTPRDSTNPKHAEAPAVVPCGGVGLVLGAGAGISSLRPAFITGFGPNSTLDGAQARAAIAKTYPEPAFARHAFTVNDEDDWEMTTYGELIGAWC